MKSNIKATNFALTPAIADYIDKRFSAFDKFVHDEKGNARLDVEVGMTTRHHKSGNIFRAEVNLHFDGKSFYAVSEKDDLYAAVDEVKDEIIHTLTSHKGKSIALMRKGAYKIKNILKGLDRRSRS